MQMFRVTYLNSNRCIVITNNICIGLGQKREHLVSGSEFLVLKSHMKVQFYATAEDVRIKQCGFTL